MSNNIKTVKLEATKTSNNKENNDPKNNKLVVKTNTNSSTKTKKAKSKKTKKAVKTTNTIVVKQVKSTKKPLTTQQEQELIGEKLSLLDYYNELRERRDELIALKNAGIVNVNDVDYICKKLAFTKGDYRVKPKKASRDINENPFTNTNQNDFLNGFNNANNNNFGFEKKPNIEVNNRERIILKQEPDVYETTRIIQQQPRVIRETTIMPPPPIVAEEVQNNQFPVAVNNQPQQVQQPLVTNITIDQKQNEQVKPKEIIDLNANAKRYNIKDIAYKLLPLQSRPVIIITVILVILLCLLITLVILWGFASDWTFTFDFFIENFKNMFSF